MKRTLYHGTSHGYIQSVRAAGLPPARPGSPGPRCRTSLAEARLDSRAVCGHLRATQAFKPKGIVLAFAIDSSRVVDRGERGLRIPGGVMPAEIRIQTIDFPELLHNRAVIAAAQERHEVMQAAAGRVSPRVRRS